MSPRAWQQPDHCEGGVAAAHVGRMSEDRPEPAGARERFERAAGIGDRHEARRVGPRGQVVIERERLDGAARLAAQTTNNVRSKSAARATARTALGSELSSTDSDAFAKLDASTSGARLDPPIPHTTVRRRPSRRTASAKRTRSSHCASDACGAVLHPSRSIGRET